MTASGVEFFPCRVQLIGLPRSVPISAVATNILPNATASLQSGTRCPPLLSKVQKVSRNLFGAPDPVEINNIYQQEAKRQRSYVLQRYSFDTKTSKPTDTQMSKLPTESFNIDATSHNTQLPTLIEQELEQHELRLQKEECNLNSASFKKTPYNSKTISMAPNGLKVKRNCIFQDTSLMFNLTASGRNKPYARQSLLTESFNIRMKSSLIKPHRNLKAIQLPRTMPGAPEQSGPLNKKDDKKSSTTIDENKKGVGDDSDTNNISSCSNCSNCTTYSLKVVVSSQNASFDTSSSASNTHADHV